jgi:hypothetical protein
VPLAPHGPIIFFFLFHSPQLRPEGVDSKRNKGEWNGNGPVDPEVRLEEVRVLRSIPIEEGYGKE